MGTILYDDKTILEAKRHIDMFNTEIIEAMSKIDSELIHMGETLNTPNSNKTMEIYKDLSTKKLKYVRNMKDNCNNILNTISVEYSNYSSVINRMVGGSNGSN